jgi:hypothetical protein
VTNLQLLWNRVVIKRIRRRIVKGDNSGFNLSPNPLKGERNRWADCDRFPACTHEEVLSRRKP